MISVVVPVLNEAENVRTLIQEIHQISGSIPIRDIVFVDDGSSDDTLATLRLLIGDVPSLRVVHHDRPFGQSAAFLSGARAATQDLLVFMDGDLQNDPADIVLLFESYRGARHASNSKIAVLGQRTIRQDNTLRKISSRLANGLRAAVLNDSTRDTGCSLKMIRRQDFLELPYFDHMHRFLPALLLRNGVKLVHANVSHRPRVHGRSKYGFWNRVLVGVFDLLGTAWLMHRGLPPDYQSTEPIKAELQ